MHAGRSTADDDALSGTHSSSSHSTDLPPLNSDVQADAARIAALFSRGDGGAAGGHGSALSSSNGPAPPSDTTDAPFTFVRPPPPPPLHM